MKAIILAAGKGTRMLPLTEHVPKPLLEVKGKALIDYHLESLSRAGIKEIVINLHHLGDMIEAHVGNGSHYGVKVMYSREDELLETAGGIRQALPLLGPDAFIALSADIFTDYAFEKLTHVSTSHAHLVMVDNPPHHTEGDFAVDSSGHLSHSGEKLNYSNIGVYHPSFFLGENDFEGPQKLRALMDPAIEKMQLTGEHYRGVWVNVGSIEQLEALNQ